MTFPGSFSWKSISIALCPKCYSCAYIILANWCFCFLTEPQILDWGQCLAYHLLPQPNSGHVGPYLIGTETVSFWGQGCFFSFFFLVVVLGVEHTTWATPPAYALIFLRWGLALCPGQPGLHFIYLCFLSSWNDRHMLLLLVEMVSSELLPGLALNHDSPNLCLTRS
jgi:hypothetical protein